MGSLFLGGLVEIHWSYNSTVEQRMASVGTTKGRLSSEAAVLLIGLLPSSCGLGPLEA